MVDVFYAEELVANKLTDRDDFLDPAVKEKKRFEQMLELGCRHFALLFDDIPDQMAAEDLKAGRTVVIADVEIAGVGGYFVGERTRAYVETGKRKAIVVPTAAPAPS